MTESTQEPPRPGSIKATQAAAEVRNLRRWYYDRVKNAKQNNEFIAWSMEGAPLEIFFAFDVLPVLAENFAPICAAKQVSPYFCEKAEAEGFSIDVCSYQKVGIGYAIALNQFGDIPPEAPYGGMGKPDMMIAPSHICDGRYKYLQATCRYVDVPYYPYEVQDMPYDVLDRKDEEERKRYVEHYYDQLKGVVAFLEKITGKKYDPGRLSETLYYWLQAHAYFHDAAELRKCRPSPLPSQDSFAVCMPNLTFKGTKEAADYYMRLYQEIKQRADNKIGSVKGEEKYRIFWWGLPPWHNLAIFNYLEDHGICTLDNLYDPGEIPEGIDFSDPLRAIADIFYSCYIFAGGLFKRRGERGILNFLRDYELDGIVTLLTTTCRITTGTLHTRRVIEELSGLPVLNLEADMTDTRTWSDAHIKTRLDAFMETVETSKRRREQSREM